MSGANPRIIRYDPSDLSSRTWVSGQGNAHGVGYAGGQVYWTQYQPAGTVRTSPSEGNAQDLATAQAGPRDVAVFGGNVYFTNQTEGTVKRIAAGTTTPVTVHSDPSSQPLSIVADASGAYWVELVSGKVQMVSHTGNAAVTLASGQAQVQSLAVDAVSVYWASPGGGTVMRVAK